MHGFKNLGAGLAAIVILTGCSTAVQDAQGPSPPPPQPQPLPQSAAASFSVAPDAQGFLCAHGKVSATLTIDSDLPINLPVICATNTVSATLNELTPASHRFVIEYSLDGIAISAAYETAVLIAGTATTLNFEMLHYHDNDGDGFTNLAELLTFGVYSFAWNDPTLRPLAETPRFSRDYVLVDHLGTAFAVGASGSANYQLTPDS